MALCPTLIVSNILKYSLNSLILERKEENTFKGLWNSKRDFKERGMCFIFVWDILFSPGSFITNMCTPENSHIVLFPTTTNCRKCIFTNSGSKWNLKLGRNSRKMKNWEVLYSHHAVKHIAQKRHWTLLEERRLRTENAFILLHSSPSNSSVPDNFPESSSDRRFSVLTKSHLTSDLIVHGPTSWVLSEFISIRVKFHFPWMLPPESKLNRYELQKCCRLEQKSI